MNAGSAVVLVIVLGLAGLAVWRAWKKGAPCTCGEKKCPGGSCCHCHD